MTAAEQSLQIATVISVSDTSVKRILKSLLADAKHVPIISCICGEDGCPFLSPVLKKSGKCCATVYSGCILIAFAVICVCVCVCV